MQTGNVQADSNSIGDEKLKRAMSWVAVILIALFGTVALGRVLLLGYEEGAWLEIAKKEFPAVVGLPMAAIASLFVVLVLRMSTGPIEVELGTLKFKGAAAPIVFWLICFLAIAGAIKMLWLKI